MLVLLQVLPSFYVIVLFKRISCIPIPDDMSLIKEIYEQNFFLHKKKLETTQYSNKIFVQR